MSMLEGERASGPTFFYGDCFYHGWIVPIVEPAVATDLLGSMKNFHHPRLLDTHRSRRQRRTSIYVFTTDNSVGILFWLFALF